MSQKSLKHDGKESRPLAVALHYDNEHTPTVTAKGYGKVAEKIIETAKDNNVPVQNNALLAQALSTIPLDDEIPRDLYKAVAEVLGFVLRARRKAGR